MSPSLAYHTDLALRRREGAAITRASHRTVIRSPNNPTFWWGNFLLMPRPPGPGDLERWLAAFEAEFPGTTHRAFGIDTADGEAGDTEAFGAAGFEVHRDTVLTTTQTVPPRRLNHDAHLRPLEGDADWQAALTLRLAVNAADPAPLAQDSYRDFATRKLAAYRAAQAAGRGAVWGLSTTREGCSQGWASSTLGRAWPGIRAWKHTRRPGHAGWPARWCTRQASGRDRRWARAHWSSWPIPVTTPSNCTNASAFAPPRFNWVFSGARHWPEPLRLPGRAERGQSQHTRGHLFPACFPEGVNP